MEARTATRSDLAKVFRHLADRMEAEYKNAGFNVDQAKQFLRVSVDAGRAHALVEQSKVLALITWDLRDGAAHTSFAATEEFFQGKFMKWFGDHLRQIQSLVGGVDLVSESWSTLESVPGWFKRLGYLDPIQKGGALFYVLPASPPLTEADPQVAEG